MKIKLTILFGTLLVLTISFLLAKKFIFSGNISANRNNKATNLAILSSPLPSQNPTPVLSPTPIPQASPSATPIPLPDPKIYGPCRNIPVFLYHHIQPEDQAMTKGQKNISVDSAIFTKQMQYLAARGYNTLTPDEFVSDLSSGLLPSKPILLTFDDGYEDFYKYAYPQLVADNLKATVFVVTGLVGNPDYLSWAEISEMKGSGKITFADHTWSHKALGNVSLEKAKYEIGTAKNQLEQHGLGPVTSFAYPYGSKGDNAVQVLEELGIKAAFTTVPGWYQCAKLPYSFRRNRVGNASLSSYGL